MQSSLPAVSRQRTAARATHMPYVKRSGITRLETPNFPAPGKPSKAATALSTAPAPTSSAPASADRCQVATVVESPLQLTATALSKPSLREVNDNQCHLDEANGSVRGPSGGTAVLTSTWPKWQWRHHIAAVCQRLDHVMQETELILMRESSTNSVALTQQDQIALFDEVHNPLIGPCVPTLAQTLDAVQRYRSGCISALLELHAILHEAPADTTMCQDTTPAAALTASKARTSSGTSGAAAPTQAAELAQLQRDYRLLEGRLSEALAVQAAYMAEVAAQQRQRQRDGVFGEYMWATRLLVEQEAAERLHLVKLCECVAPLFTASLVHQTEAKPEKSKRMSMVEAAAGAARTRRPSQDDPIVAQLTAEKEALLVELKQQTSRTQSLLSTQRRDAQAANERALAQLVARHDAEKSVWESRLNEANREVDALQQTASTAQDKLKHAQEQQQEAEEYASLTTADLQAQLRVATKRMWQLQLANDHLDAKVRVLQRELEEVRLSRSPLRGRPTSRTPPPLSSQGGVAAPNKGAPSTTVGLIGVPAAARIRRTVAPTSSVTPRSTMSNASPRGVPRLPDPPVLRTVVDDARHGEPLLRHNDNQSSHRNQVNRKQNTIYRESHDGAMEKDVMIVNPSVWLAYDERSLLSETTPTKNESHSLINHRRDVPAKAPSTTSVTHAWGDGRPSSAVTNSSRHALSMLPSFPVPNISSARLTPAATASAAAATSGATLCRGGDDAGTNASYMSEGPTVYVSAETRPHLSATAKASNTTTTTTSAVDRYEELRRDTYLQQQHDVARRQLSLDHTPATVPPQQQSFSTSHDTSFATTNDVMVGAEDKPPLTCAGDIDDGTGHGDYGDAAAEATTTLNVDEEEEPETHEPPPLLHPSGLSPLATLIPPSFRPHVNSDIEDDNDNVCRPVTYPHGAVVTSRSSPTTKSSDTQNREKVEREEDSTASLPPSSRERLENVRREIIHHTEMLERDVQTVTARHNAAQRQRRRERDIIRANASSIHASPTGQKGGKNNHNGDEHKDAEDGVDDGHTSDVDCALERLHIAQQEDDDQLAQYYAEVNRKRVELERCLRVVEERLAPRHRDPASKERT